jgi:hypothetical protein
LVLGVVFACLTASRQDVEIKTDAVEPQRLQWYAARRLLIDYGNSQRKDLREVARLAALSDDPDAKWVTEVLTRGGRLPSTRRKAKAMFLKEVDK